MSSLTSDQQDFSNIDHPFFSVHSPCFITREEDDALLDSASSFGATSNIYASPIRNENTLGLYEVPSFNLEFEPHWVALGNPSAERTLDQCNLGPSLLPGVESASGIQHLWGSSLPQDPLVYEEAAIADFGDNLALFFSRTLPLSGSPQAQKPNARSPHKNLSGSSRSTHSRGLLRYTPYSFGPDQIQRESPTLTYRCQWFDGRALCGVEVLATRHAIGQHLQFAHAIQLKADKTSQACHWGRCGKPMRKESIARHILEVHMQDKVLCPICGSTFARTDSMQRHQKTHNRDESDTRNATK